MREQDERNRITIGLDLGDRRHRFCVLDGKGEVVEEGTLSNKRESLSELSRRYRRALVVMEAGDVTVRGLAGIWRERVVKWSCLIRARPGRFISTNAKAIGAMHSCWRASPGWSRPCFIQCSTEAPRRSTISCASSYATVWSGHEWE